MNNKGFAISTMLYGLIIIISLVMMSIISVMAFNRSNSKKFTENIRYELENKETKVFKVGDYIKMIPSSNTYTVNSMDSGYDQDQTINPSELQLWRVISKDSNGIEAVSEYVSSSVVHFSSTVGYTKYVGTLKKIAQSYQSNFTQSVRIFGYNGQTETIGNENSSKYDGSTNLSETTNTNSRPGEDEYSGGAFGDNKYKKDVELVGDLYKKDSDIYGTSGLKASDVVTKNEKNYWVSSREFRSTNPNTYSFRGRYINSATGSVQGDNFCNAYTTDNTWQFFGGGNALRPIITLKSGLVPDGGSGTKDDPYTLK